MKNKFFMVFIFLFLIQFIQIFQGFSIIDPGFYMTFYQNIFSTPHSVEANFACYFSGVIGGLFLKLFPDSGIIGMRLLGIINNMAIIFLTYKLLKNHIDDLAIFIGLFIVTIAFHRMPLEFFHNSLSIFLFISSAYTLFLGLTRQKYFYLALSGTFVALNTFTRLPNILDLGLIFIIVLHFIICKAKTKILFKNCLAFLVGFSLSVIVILAFMKIFGHLGSYINAMLLLSTAASDNTQGSHGIINMLYTNYSSYIGLLRPATKIFSIIIIIALVENFLQNKYLLWLSRILLSLYLWRTLLTIENVSVLYIFSLTSITLILSSKKTDKSLRLLSWIALFMILVMPFGSDEALGNFGWFTSWISVPIAINFVLRLFDQRFEFSLIINDRTKKLQFTVWKMKSVFVLFLLVFTFTCFEKLFFNGCYFDAGNRFKKTWSINNDKAKCIFTTRTRSEIINDVLSGIRPYVKSGEFLFVYDSSPMLNYLTVTKPYAGNSWPGLYNAAMLSDKLAQARVKDGLPMVLRQKFQSVSFDFGEPSDLYLTDGGVKNDRFNSNDKIKVINEFLAIYDYKELWSNDYYVLLASPEDFKEFNHAD